MNAYVRIYVDMKDEDTVKANSPGHYDLMLGKATQKFNEEYYSYPVFSFGGDDGHQGYLRVFDADDAKEMYVGRRVYLYADPIEIDDSDLNNFLTKLEASIDKDEVDGLGKPGKKYKVKSDPFDTYTLKKYNCFGALAYWVKWLGYNKLYDIWSKAESNKVYYACNMLTEYGDHWQKIAYWDLT